MKLDIYHGHLFLQWENDGAYLTDQLGYVLELEQLLFVAEELKKYAKKNKKKIEKKNIDTDKYYHDLFNNHKRNDRERVKRPGYVYLMESGGKYKIGFSKDVSRRAKELNNRPFPVTILSVSKKTENARDEEKRLHDALSKHRIDGEWYEFGKETVDRIAKYIESIDDGAFISCAEV